MNVLVLCTGNSARSILLECLLRRKSKGRISAFSAGSQPSGKVHPQSLKLLASLGYETADLSSKSWDVFAAPDAPKMDAVITVCGSAASEVCPIWPGAPVTAHWGVEDPAASEPEAWEPAFQTAYDVLERRADALCALPLEKMSPDDLKPALDRIGQIP